MACASSISRLPRNALLSALARCIGLIAALFALLLAEALPAAAQVLGQGGDDSVSMWRVAAALLVCVLLAVGGAFALRTRMGTGALVFAPPRGRRLKLVETLRLSPQSTLCIVDCDGRELLVMASPAGAELLDRLSPRETRPVRQADGMS